MFNDKILIVPAVLVLALLAYLKPDKIIIDFYMILASGFFGLVAGIGIGAINKDKRELPKP